MLHAIIRLASAAREKRKMKENAPAFASNAFLSRVYVIGGPAKFFVGSADESRFIDFCLKIC